MPTPCPAAEPERIRVDRARRLRVLVVEDDPLVRAAVIEQLDSQGHTVETANNGLEGLDKFMSSQFDLVVTDRAMPEMGGDQLATTIKQLAPDRPIIMLTGFGDLMDAKGEKPAGVDVVIGKPVTFDALQGAILQSSPATDTRLDHVRSVPAGLDSRADECYERRRHRHTSPVL